MKSLSTYIGDAAENFSVPRGSEIAGDRAVLPEGAEEPIHVYVNGVEQRPGLDYRVEDEAVIFARPILHEGNLGFSRWAALYLGFFGTYRIDESVDLHYTVNGKMVVAPAVRITGPRGPEAESPGADPTG